MKSFLVRFLGTSRPVEMSPEQREAQRRSFVYGTTKLANDAITKDLVDDLAWVTQMYVLVACNELEDAIDLLYDNVGELLLAGKMSECDAILRTIDIHRLEGNLMVGILSITLAAREHLPHRKTLVAEIEEHFRLTDPKNVEALMSGLR